MLHPYLIVCNVERERFQRREKERLCAPIWSSKEVEKLMVHGRVSMSKGVVKPQGMKTNSEVGQLREALKERRESRGVDDVDVK